MNRIFAVVIIGLAATPPWISPTIAQERIDLFTRTWSGSSGSTNAGKMKSDSSSDLTSQNVRQLAILGPNGQAIFAASFSGRLFKSSDHGDHWNAVGGLPSGRAWAVAADATGSRIIFAMVDDSIYQSRDAGATWFRVGVDATSTVNSLPTLDLSQPLVIRADFRDRILYSVDGGESWSLFMPHLPISDPFPSVWVHPHESQALYASGLIGGLFRSRDGGRTWNQVSEAPRSLNYTFFVDVNRAETMYMLTHEGSFPSHTYKSIDNGSHWEPMLVDVSLNASPEFLAMIPSEPTVLFIALADHRSCCPRPTTLFKSIDQGSHWRRADSGLPKGKGVGSIVPLRDDPSILYLVGETGVFKSTDGGEHWHRTGAR